MVEEVDGVIKAWAAAYTDQVQAFVGIAAFFNRFLRFMGDETDGRIYICYVQPFRWKIKAKFLFIAVIYLSLSIQKNILTQYNNCYVVLTTYMLDSDLQPSYILSKNLLLLPWILKLIEDMVNDSTLLNNFDILTTA